MKGPLSAPLLVELLTEELPPRALQKLGNAFGESIARHLRAHGLADAQAPAAPQIHCTPRRLGVVIDEVLAEAPSRQLQLKGLTSPSHWTRKASRPWR